MGVVGRGRRHRPPQQSRCTAAAAIARRPETEVLCALAANKDAPLDAHATSYLLRRGRTDRELGYVFLARADLRIDKSVLFLLANAQQRAEMLTTARESDHGARCRHKPMPQRDLDALADLAAAQSGGSLPSNWPCASAAIRGRLSVTNRANRSRSH